MYQVYTNLWEYSGKQMNMAPALPELTVHEGSQTINQKLQESLIGVVTGDVQRCFRIA